MTYYFDFHPMLDSHILMGPPTTNRDKTVYGRINRAAGGVCWACYGAEKPIRFTELDKAKAYMMALVRLS